MNLILNRKGTGIIQGNDTCFQSTELNYLNTNEMRKSRCTEQRQKPVKHIQTQRLTRFLKIYRPDVILLLCQDNGSFLPFAAQPPFKAVCMRVIYRELLSGLAAIRG